MTSLANWSGALQSHASLAQALPVINRPLNDLIDFSNLLQTNLTDKVTTYLAGGAVDSDGVLAAINGVFGNVTVSASYDENGTPEVTDDVFSVTLTQTITATPTNLDLSAQDGGTGLSLGAGGQVDMDLTVSIALDFGLDDLAVDGSGFFVEPGAMSVTATGAMSDFATTVDLGFVDFAASVDADLSATATIMPVGGAPDPLRIADLTAGNFDVSLSGTANLDMTGDAGFGSETIGIDWTGDLTTPTVDANLNLLAGLGSVTAADFTALFDGVSAFLGKLDASGSLLGDLPVFGDSLVNLADPAGLVDDLLGGLPNFADMSELRTQIVNAADLSDLGLQRGDLDGDGVDDAVWLDLGFSGARTGTVSGEWTERGALDLSADFSVDNATVGVSGQLGLGVDLRDETPTMFLRAGANAPAIQITTSLTGIDASASVGLLDVAITGGSANANVGLRLRQSGGSETITLASLNGPVPTPESFAEVTGAMSLTLHLEVAALGVMRDLTASWADLTDPSQFTTNADTFVNLNDWRDLSAQDVTNALAELPDILRRLVDGGYVDDLPYVGDTLTRASNLADEIEAALQAMGAFDSTADLLAALQAIPDFSMVDLTTGTDALEISLDMSADLDETLDITVEQNIGGGLGELSFAGQAQVLGTTQASITLGVFLDNTIDADDRVYLRAGGDTALDVGFRLLTDTPFLAAAALGPLRVEARNVDLAIARRNPQNGQIDRTGNATFSTQLRDQGVQDGITLLSELLANPINGFQAPTLQGIATLSADLAAESGVGAATVPLSVTQRLDRLNTAPSISINTADLSNLLPDDPADLLTPGILDDTARAFLAQLQPWLTQFANSAGQNPLLDTTIPVLDTSLRDLLTIDTLLADFGSALLSFADDPQGAADAVAARAADAIENLSDAARDFVVDRANMFSGMVDAAATDAAEQLGLSTGTDQFVMQIGTTISLPFENARSLLGVGDTELNLSLEAGLGGSTDVQIQITMGVLLDPDLPVEQAVFLRLDQFDVDLSADVDPDFDSDIEVGILDLELEGNSNFSIRAGLSGGMVQTAGAPPQALTLGQVLGTSTDGLLNLRVTESEVSGAFIMTANLTNIGSGTLLVTATGDPFSGDPVTYVFSGQLADQASEFSGLTADGFLASLQQIAGWLSSLGGADFLDKDLPFTDLSVGEAIDWGAAFEAQVTSVLADANGFANFSSIEELVARLGCLGGDRPG